MAAPRRRSNRAAWIATCMVAAALRVPASAGGAEDPLQDREAFLAGMRTRLRADAAILAEYAYTRSVVERMLDGNGRVKETHTRVFEVRPLPDDPDGHRWLTMKDGVPTAPLEQQRLEAEYRTRLARAGRRIANESADDRQRRLARAAERDREAR